MNYGIAVLMLVTQLGPGAATSRPATAPMTVTIYNAELGEGRKLRVTTDRITRAPLNAESQRILREGFGPGWGGGGTVTERGWRVRATIISPDGQEQLIWINDIHDDVASPNGLTILDAKLFGRVMVIVYRNGTGVNAEVVSPEVAGYSLLSSFMPPPNKEGYQRPNHSSLAGSELGYRYWETRAKITGSIDEGNLTVTLTADNELTFILMPDGEAYRWVLSKSSPSRSTTRRSR